MVQMRQMSSEEIKELKETYVYDPLTGKLTFKVKKGHKPVGSVAGTINKDGYIQVHFNYKIYLLHRLAFVFMQGRLPESYVDHIDRDRLNNKWDNLRECSRTENNRNKSLSSRNTSGITGVSFNTRSGRWHAYICDESRMISLGYYATLEEAAKVRKKAEEFYGYGVDKES